MEENELSLKTNIFPTKLWQLVNDSDVDAVVWNHQGDGIIINENLIENDFLTLNGLKASSFASFVHRLNLYGFEKSEDFNHEPGNHHYFHPNFKRTQLQLPLLRGCNQRSRPSVKAEVRNDLTERWRGHRHLCDSDDGATDANLPRGESQLLTKEICHPHHPLKGTPLHSKVYHV